MAAAGRLGKSGGTWGRNRLADLQFELRASERIEAVRGLQSLGSPLIEPLGVLARGRLAVRCSHRVHEGPKIGGTPPVVRRGEETVKTFLLKLRQPLALSTFIFFPTPANLGRNLLSVLEEEAVDDAEAPHFKG